MVVTPKTQEVYQRCKQYRYLHWFAIKGQSGDKPLIANPTKQDVTYRGRKTGIDLYKIGVDHAKEVLYSRSQIETPGAKYLNFPNDLDSDWYEGFCSEVQVTKHRNGQPYMVWEPLAGIRNEPLDTAVYALAAAHLAGMTRMNWSKIERELDEGSPKGLASASGQRADGRSQESRVKSQEYHKGITSNDLSSSDHRVDKDRSSTKEAPIKSKANVRSRTRTRRRRSSSNFTTDIY